MTGPRRARHGAYELSDDPARIDVDAVHAMLVGAYWCRGIPREVVARSLAHSLPFGAFDAAGRQVAVARVISDRATFAYLCDVFVVPEARGRGVGQALVAFIMSHPELQGLRRWCLLTADANSLYERFGFRNLDDPRRYMEVSTRDLYLRGGPYPPP